MTSYQPLIAIDVGQSSIRAGLFLDEETQLPTDFPLLADVPLIPQLGTVIRNVVSMWPVANARVAAAVSSPLPSNGDADAILHACRDVGILSVHLAHDSISGYLGCLGESRGSVIAAGTGVVTLATGVTTYCRVDGWGNSGGIADSSYRIGRAGPGAAVQAHVGHGGSTAMLELLRRDFPDVETAYIQVESNPERISFLASYAGEIVDLSNDDELTARVVDHVTDELALSVGVSLRQTGWMPASNPHIGWAGTILSNPRMVEPLRHKLSRSWPRAQLVSPCDSPRDGVAYLADLPVSHPLHPLLNVASTTDRVSL